MTVIGGVVGGEAVERSGYGYSFMVGFDPEQWRAGYCSTLCSGSMKGSNVMANAQESLWDIVEVAAYLKVPVSSIYKMTGKRAGLRIPHIKLSGRLRFRQRDVDRWLELLSVSNMDTLEKTRKLARRSYGNYPQEEAPQR